MKWIKYTDEIEDAAGNPIVIPSMDRKANRAWEDAIQKERSKAVKIAQESGVADIPLDLPPRPFTTATFRDCLIYFHNNGTWTRDENGAPTKQRTVEEQDWDLQIVRAMQNPDVERSLIKLDDQALEWSLDCLKDEGIKAFRGTVPAILRERLSGYNVLEGEPTHGGQNF